MPHGTSFDQALSRLEPIFFKTLNRMIYLQPSAYSGYTGSNPADRIAMASV